MYLLYTGVEEMCKKLICLFSFCSIYSRIGRNRNIIATTCGIWKIYIKRIFYIYTFLNTILLIPSALFLVVFVVWNERKKKKTLTTLGSFIKKKYKKNFFFNLKCWVNFWKILYSIDFMENSLYYKIYHSQVST